MSKGGQIQETPQQRALAERASATMADYRSRWLPLQKQFIAHVQGQGAEGSATRKAVEGRSATDIEASFGQAQGALEKSMSNKGVAPGSSRSNLAVTGMGTDLAGAKGMSAVISDQQVDDAYLQGLNQLAQLGQGKAAMSGSGLADQARTSGVQAGLDARASLERQQGMGQLAGTAAGIGLQSAFGKTPQGPNFVTPEDIEAMRD